MQEHPVPQQISSYQFRLVGDMTLKQFFQIGGGAIGALLIYATSLPAIFKWPLMLGSFGFGAALAFLPLEDRPLSRWIVAFFRSVYTPTLYAWQPVANVSYYQSEAATTSTLPAIPNPVKSNTADKILDKLEDAETSFLSKVGNLFGPAAAPATPVTANPAPIPTTPPLHIVNQLVNNPAPAAPKPQVFIPQATTIKVDTTTPSPVKPLPFQEPVANTPVQAVPMGNAVLNGSQTPLNALQAQFSIDAAPPTPPSIPNVVVGQVMDMQGKIIEAAILEIRDSLGRPVRALRTNKAGHFLIVTPLANGSYEITTEKDGFIFPTLKFDAKGQILAPIAIRASGRQNVTQEL